jgi:hypothetical protein
MDNELSVKNITIFLDNKFLYTHPKAQGLRYQQWRYLESRKILSKLQQYLILKYIYMF